MDGGTRDHLQNPTTERERSEQTNHMAKTKKSKPAAKKNSKASAQQADRSYPIIHSQCLVSTDPPGNGTGATYLIELHYQRNEDVEYVELPLDTAQEFIAVTTLIQTGRAVYYPAHKKVAVERWDLEPIMPMGFGTR
jgi:hypothetical protein